MFADLVDQEPRRLIAMVYAMVAVALMDLPGRNTASVAEELGFSSAGTLCKSVRRATGKTFGEIHEAGGIDYLANLFAQRFGGGAAKSRQHAALGQVDSTVEAIAHMDLQLLLDFGAQAG